ncbi:MAG: hypothetical protein L0271_05370, partial [Gemmatimonadetes bacterium]|nr:hypothetical protein [Gemmatimonadota bacterium]
GSKLFFASWVGTGRNTALDLHEYNGGGIKRLTTTRSENMAPSLSPDGSTMAFQSTRTGRHHVYVMPSGGGNPRMISPLGESAEFHAPDWSPVSAQVVFHGISRGVYQLMLADASRPGSTVTQLTSSGRSEDPSWAPDGRHIVYTGVGASGVGLYVIDVVTGEVRQLVRGAKLRMADWSGSLAHAASARTQPGR